MSDAAPDTLHAPPGRASAEDLRRQRSFITDEPLLVTFMDAVPSAVMVLNRQRQIIFVNAYMRGLIGRTTPDAVGCRPGEALRCAHATDREAGCGTSEFCRECGAVKAILKSQEGSPDVQECRLTLENGEPLTLRVHATPVAMRGEPFTIFVAMDVSDEKRRLSLERIFFHDILNTAGNLRMAAGLLADDAQAGNHEAVKRILQSSSERLIEEITSQRDLSAAEYGDLPVSLAPVSSRQALQEIVDAYAPSDLAKGRRLVIDARSEDVRFRSDPVLLRRVVGNMVKNALEATPEGGAVTACATQRGELVEFAVHNPAVMPREVQLQMFQRSFSTKGADRGLGTYSMKLLTERYLHGRIGFHSTEGQGTTFHAAYPLAGPDPAPAPPGR